MQMKPPVCCILGTTDDQKAEKAVQEQSGSTNPLQQVHPLYNESTGTTWNSEVSVEFVVQDEDVDEQECAIRLTIGSARCY